MNQKPPTGSSTSVDISASSSTSPPENDVMLQRRVGLVSGIALTMGTIIGSGIFVSPKSVLERSGSVALTLIIWPLSGLFCMMASLAYAELGLAIPLTGGEYSYYDEILGSFPAFLFAWINVFLIKPACLSIVCLTFAEYVHKGIGTSYCESEVAIKLICVLTIVLTTFINCWSFKLATKIQNIFTAIKLFVIVFVMMTGVVFLLLGNTKYLRAGFQGTTTSISDIAEAFYGGLWAFDGWNQLAYVMEELKNPEKNLPLSVYIGMPIVIIGFTLVNVAYLSVLTPQEILSSETVAISFGDKMYGSLSILVPIFVAISCFGTANGTAFCSARLCFSAARNNHLVCILSFINITNYLPIPALLFNSFLALLLIIPSNIEQLIDVFGFTAWLFYGGTCFALLLMRVTKKDVCIGIPILVVVFSIFLTVIPFFTHPTWEHLYPVGFTLIGIVVYIVFVVYKVRLKGMHEVTKMIQIVLNVAPTSKPPEQF